MTDYLFVYGTLVRNSKHNSKLMLEEMECIGTGKIHGKMYDLGEYPGVIENNEKYVYGEIYRIHDLKILSAIDEYEEVAQLESQKGLYIRKITNAILDQGKEIQVFAYFYNKSIQNMKEIPSGKWNENN